MPSSSMDTVFSFIVICVIGGKKFQIFKFLVSNTTTKLHAMYVYGLDRFIHRCSFYYPVYALHKVTKSKMTY